jgi:hypothetical protein
MTNILLTNVAIDGVSDPEEPDIMVFSSLSAGTIEAAYRQTGSVTFDECYAVEDHDLQHYLYSPCYLSRYEESRAIELAMKFLKGLPQCTKQ